jgi:hypothetical protein
MKQIFCFLIVSLLIVVVNGCASINMIETLPPDIDEVILSPTEELPSLTETVSPTNTVTLTPIPQQPPVTPSFTWTPINTLDSQEREETLFANFTNNGGCNLPCWWGIIPGETSWEEVQTKLSPLGTMFKRGDYDFSHVTFSIMVPLELPDAIDPSFPYFEPNLIIKRDIVETILINASWVSENLDYSLMGFLQMFGPPTEIFLRSSLDVMEEASYWNKPYYNMIVFFPDNGVFVFSSDMYQGTEDELELCPGEVKFGSSPAGLLLFSPKPNLTLANYLEANENFQLDEYQSITEITHISKMKDFYDLFKEPDGVQCLEINMSKIEDWHELK